MEKKKLIASLLASLGLLGAGLVGLVGTILYQGSRHADAEAECMSRSKNQCNGKCELKDIGGCPEGSAQSCWEGQECGVKWSLWY